MYATKTLSEPSCPAWLAQRVQTAAQGSSSKPRLILVLMQVLGVAALALFGAIGAWLGKAANGLALLCAPAWDKQDAFLLSLLVAPLE